jgi:hypothetical protein
VIGWLDVTLAVLLIWVAIDLAIAAAIVSAAGRRGRERSARSRA